MVPLPWRCLHERRGNTCANLTSVKSPTCRWLSARLQKIIIAQRGWPGKTRQSHQLWSTRYVVLTITGESLWDHKKHGTDRTFRQTAFTLRPLTDLQSVVTNKGESWSPQLTQNTKDQNLENTKQHIKLIGTNTCFSLLIMMTPKGTDRPQLKHTSKNHLPTNPGENALRTDHRQGSSLLPRAP